MEVVFTPAFGRAAAKAGAPFLFYMAARAGESRANVRKPKLSAVQIKVAAEGGRRVNVA